MAETPENIQDRSFNFACSLIDFLRSENLREEAGKVILRQLLKSGTSIGANLEEASAGQSKADFISKSSIALKEARETYYWLRLLKRTKISKSSRLDELLDEVRQITAVLTVIVKKAAQSPNREKLR